MLFLGNIRGKELPTSPNRQHVQFHLLPDVKRITEIGIPCILPVAQRIKGIKLPDLRFMIHQLICHHKC